MLCLRVTDERVLDRIVLKIVRCWPEVGLQIHEMGACWILEIG